MVNPINDSSKPLVPVLDSQRQKNLSQKYNEYASINVEFSEQAKKFKMLEGDNPLVGVLKNEFDEVFGFDDNKKELLLEKLDRILVDSAL